MKKYNKTSDIVSSQVPSFFLEDYPTFVNFLQAYYRFLETQKVNRNLENFRDIDTTLTDFVDILKNEFAHSSPNYANTKLYLAHLKQHFVSRGSEESFALLFRLLLNKDIEIQHPSDSILRISDGKWAQDYSIFVQLTDGDINDVLGQYVYVQTATKKIRINILNISVIDIVNSIYELFFDKQYYGIIHVDDTISFKTANMYVLPTTSKISVVNAGKNFKVGQVFSLDSDLGSGTSIKIVKVGINGSISEIKIISFGIGYQSDFYISISNSTVGGGLFSYPVTSQIRNLVGGGTEIIYQNPITTGYQDPTVPFIESGFINTQDYFHDSAFYSDGTYVGNVIGQFYSDNSKTMDDSFALLFIKLGSISKYPGAYSTTDSFVSGVSYIQDGDFYQDYSYLIKVDEKLDNYKQAVLQFLHPTGRKLFGEYSIQNDFLLNIETVISTIRKQFPEVVPMVDANVYSMNKGLEDSFGIAETNHYLFNKDLGVDSFTTSETNNYYMDKALSDSLGIADSIPYYTFIKSLADSFTTSETNYYSFVKSLSDSFTTSETTSIETGRLLEDSVTMSDDYILIVKGKLFEDFLSTIIDITNIDAVKVLADSATLTDINTIVTGKPLADSFTTTQTGFVQLNPYTVESYFAEEYQTGKTNFN